MISLDLYLLLNEKDSVINVCICNKELHFPSCFDQNVSLNTTQTFYFIMFLSTAGTSKLHKPRELWHSGWWSAKITLWIALMILSFFIPSAFIQLYG